MKLARNALLSCVGAVALVGCSQSADSSGPQPVAVADAKGNIRLPDNFDRWPVLGAWATASAGAETPVNEMHTVYVSPGGIESFRETGAFADGTVLVKEVRGAKASPLTTGNAHWPTDTKVWFVMVKDAANSHPDNPLWREGWGWALFEAGSPGKQVAESFEDACQACHEPARDTDWIYQAAYPVLRSGKFEAPSWDGGAGS